jgi:hypothetical protein
VRRSPVDFAQPQGSDSETLNPVESQEESVERWPAKKVVAVMDSPVTYRSVNGRSFPIRRSDVSPSPVLLYNDMATRNLSDHLPSRVWLPETTSVTWSSLGQRCPLAYNKLLNSCQSVTLSCLLHFKEYSLSTDCTIMYQ